MSDNGDDHPQDPHVERVRPDPSQPPQATRTLIGFLGDSDRPGMRRLYLSDSLDYYAEFRTDDVVAMTAVPPEQSPFPGQQVTQLMLRRDATVDYTLTHTPKPVDEFDLDVQLGAPHAVQALPTQTRAPFLCATEVTTCLANCEIAVPYLTGLICRPTRTCPTGCDLTCGCPPTLVTCNTCYTHCGQNTCAQTCTCNTQCGQNTCAQTCTCNTQCGQNTCAQTCTCNTQCGQYTCDKNMTPCHP